MTTSISEIVENRLCHGCGACAYACGENAIELRNFLDVGIRPVVESDRCSSCGDCTTVCSGIDLRHDRQQWPTGAKKELSGEWGPVLELWEGHAADAQIRFRGGSGGVATALAAFALEQENMHGVLHVAMDTTRPYLNQTVMSCSRDELTARTGSRYAPASVCADLKEIEQAPAPCVLIGKPCDIASASKARAIRPQLDRNLGLTISVFCGGTPSTRGTLKMLGALGVEPDDVAELRYRGHGWPGMSGVNLKTSGNGDRVEMTYDRAWGKILAKHITFRCRICPDGTGEFADIACGDPWYRPVEDGEPGETLIVVRSERGRSLLHRAMAAGYVVAESRNPDVLPASQTGLLMRRRHAWPKLLALRLMMLPYPRFGGMPLWRNWLKLPFKRMWVSMWRSLRHVASFRRDGPLQLHGGEAVTRSTSRTDGSEQIHFAAPQNNTND
jgi:coenzyme F420 hydrogenase subunit beta